jgi:hypothetical protein
MSEVQQLVGAVQVRRVVQKGAYEPLEVLVNLQFGYDSSYSIPEVGVLANDWRLAAEAEVFSALGTDGLEATGVDDGAVAAAIAKATGGTVVTQPSAEAGDWPTPTFKGRNGRDIPTNEFKAWAKARFETNPTEFFDDTAEKNPKIKHKKTGVAVYMD